MMNKMNKVNKMNGMNKVTGSLPSKVIGSLHHSSVSTDVCHGGESIKHLGSGDSRNTVHAKCCQLS